MTRTRTIASKKPVRGESTIAEPMTPTPPQTTAMSPTLAMPAPIRPPTKAWLLLDGMPSHHVKTFQTMAPARAPNTTRGSTTHCGGWWGRCRNENATGGRTDLAGGRATDMRRGFDGLAALVAKQVK